MATTTTVARRVTDQEPNAFRPVDVAWDEDGWLKVQQEDDVIALRRDHAAAVARAITDALTDEGAPTA